MDKPTICRIFDTIAPDYDHSPGQRHFSQSARHMVEKMLLMGNEHVLDIATGTGQVALRVAEQLPTGYVTGIDLSEEMLKRAQAKADEKGLKNVTFRRMDIDAMDFAENHFDGVSCGFGMFFLPDMVSALRRIVRILKPGGWFMMTSFAEDSFLPLGEIAVRRLRGQYGVETPEMVKTRLDTTEKVLSLLELADFDRPEVETVSMGYYLSGPEEWLRLMWLSGFRGMLEQLPEDQLDNFNKEHAEELVSCQTEDGLWININVLLSKGHKL